MFNKKASIDFAIGTIMMVILGVVILSSGIVLMKHFISGAEDIKDTLDQKTEAELERLLVDQGKRVALPLSTVSIEAGESHLFGLGILNVEALTYGSEFSLGVSFSKMVDSDGLEVDLDQSLVESWLLYDSGPFLIEENDHRSERIHISTPEDAKKGNYIFNVYVYDGFGQRYDSVKKMYVTVE